MNDITLDNAAITARLRDFIDEIRELDLENKALDRRRRDLYRVASELGFNAGILKKIARSNRTAFSQGFIRDFALVWAEEGLEAVRKVAKKSPEAFVAIAARICPNDVRLTLEQAIPGGMSLEDYLLMREVIAAIREGLPSADQMQPGQVFQHVLEALHDCSKNE